MTKKGKQPTPPKDGEERPTLTADELQEEFERSIRNGTFPAHYFPEWAARFRVRIGTLVRERSQARPTRRMAAKTQPPARTDSKRREPDRPIWRNPSIWTGLKKYLDRVPNGQGEKILTKREFDQLPSVQALQERLRSRVGTFNQVEGFWEWILGLFGIKTKQNQNKLDMESWLRFRESLNLTEEEADQGRNTWMESVAPRKRSNQTTAEGTPPDQGSAQSAPTVPPEGSNPSSEILVPEQVQQQRVDGGAGEENSSQLKADKNTIVAAIPPAKKPKASKGGSVLSTPPVPLSIGKTKKEVVPKKEEIKKANAKISSEGVSTSEKTDESEATISSSETSSVSLFSSTDTSSSSNSVYVTLQENLKEKPELAEILSSAERLTQSPGLNQGWSKITPETDLKHLLEAFIAFFRRSSENKPFSAEVQSTNDLERIYLRFEEMLKHPAGRADRNDDLAVTLAVGFYIRSIRIIESGAVKEHISLLNMLIRVIRAASENAARKILISEIEEFRNSLNRQ